MGVKVLMGIIFVLAVAGGLWVVMNDGLFSGTVLPKVDASSIFVVDLTGSPAPVKLAATVSAGLLNRYFNRPAVYTLLAPNDKLWAADMQTASELSSTAWTTLTAADLVAYAIAVGAVTGTVTYDPREPWCLANVVTMSGIQNAVPIPVRGLITFADDYDLEEQLENEQQKYPRSQLMMLWSNARQSFRLRLMKKAISGPDQNLYESLLNLPLYDDVSGIWGDELDAGLYAWQHLFPLCEGTEDTIATQRPDLLSQGYLADFIVANKMFVFYLPTMCTSGPQQVLFRSIADRAFTAGKQLKIMGYNTASEVVADCSIHHTEISLVSDWCPNLSFLSRMQKRDDQYVQSSFTPAPVYNPNNTYLAVINSDGDNMQMENNGNREGMEARVSICSQPGSICPPLAWTISNNLARYAPFQLEWYYSQAQKTGRDAFLMGPSGFGFLHPAALEPDSPLLMQFVVDTVEAAEQLQMTSYVHWDIDGNDITRAMMSQILNASRSEAQSAPFRTTEALMTVASQTQRNLSTLIRNAYLEHFDGTQIETILAPGEYNVPSWIGNVAGIGEQLRWFKGTPVQDIISIINNIQRGTIGYVYKIFDVEMADLEAVAAQVGKHVQLLDHRALHDVSLQKKFYDASA